MWESVEALGERHVEQLTPWLATSSDREHNFSPVIFDRTAFQDVRRFRVEFLPLRRRHDVSL